MNQFPVTTSAAHLNAAGVVSRERELLWAIMAQFALFLGVLIACSLLACGVHDNSGLEFFNSESGSTDSGSGNLYSGSGVEDTKSGSEPVTSNSGSGLSNPGSESELENVNSGSGNLNSRLGSLYSGSGSLYSGSGGFMFEPVNSDYSGSGSK